MLNSKNVSRCFVLMFISFKISLRTHQYARIFIHIICTCLQISLYIWLMCICMRIKHTHTNKCILIFMKQGNMSINSYFHGCKICNTFLNLLFFFIWILFFYKSNIRCFVDDLFDIQFLRFQ